MSEATAKSPYTDGRRIWNERYGDSLAQARNWRLACLGSLLIAGGAVGGCVYLASQSHVVPYIVEVDHLGDKVAIGLAEQAHRKDPRIIRAELARWIVNVRTVSSDPDAETRNVDDAYALLDKHGQAYQVINDWFAAHQPYKRAAQGELVTIHVSYVRWRVGDTWLIGWHETTQGHDGTSFAPQDWEAEVVVSVNPPTEEADIHANAVGVFIENLNWGVRQ